MSLGIGWGENDADEDELQPNSQGQTQPDYQRRHGPGVASAAARSPLSRNIVASASASIPRRPRQYPRTALNAVSEGRSERAARSSSGENMDRFRQRISGVDQRSDKAPAIPTAQNGSDYITLPKRNGSHGGCDCGGGFGGPVSTQEWWAKPGRGQRWRGTGPDEGRPARAQP